MTSTSDSRLPSVDVLRGGSMAAMILVNNPGSWKHMYGWLRHAEWGHLPALADFVFPSFLFVVGVATVLSLRPKLVQGLPTARLFGRVLRRSLLLITIGLFLNLFPQFDLASVRIPGVLQRIAVVALGCAALELWCSTRAIVLWLLLLLLGYNAALLSLPIPEHGLLPLAADMNWPVWLDERVFRAHRWPGPGDPEGILSTLGALVTGGIGVLSGRLLLSSASRQQKVLRLALMALLCAIGGGASLGVLAISKELWTAPYALLTLCAPLLLLAGLFAVGTRALESTACAGLRLFGKQALLAYVLAHLLSDLSIYVVRVPDMLGSVSAHIWLESRLETLFTPELASLAFAFCMLGCVGILVWILDRSGLRLRL